jgi:hypothetical protein
MSDHKQLVVSSIQNVCPSLVAADHVREPASAPTCATSVSSLNSSMLASQASSWSYPAGAGCATVIAIQLSAGERDTCCTCAWVHCCGNSGGQQSTAVVHNPAMYDCRHQHQEQHTLTHQSQSPAATLQHIVISSRLRHQSCFCWTAWTSFITALGG